MTSQDLAVAFFVAIVVGFLAYRFYSGKKEEKKGKSGGAGGGGNNRQKH